MNSKYLADENIPAKIVKELKEVGIKIENLLEEMRGISDKKLSYSFSKNLILITFDKDFGQLVFKEKVNAKGINPIKVPISKKDKNDN